MSSRLVTHLRSRVLRGLLVLLPLLITLWLLGLLLRLFQRLLTPLLRAMLGQAGLPVDEGWFGHLAVPLFGVIAGVALVYGIGLVAGHLAGRRLVAWIERGILRIPLVSRIYGSARQLLDAFTASGGNAFSKVVIVEYPRLGLWTVGFVTCEVEHRIAEGATGAVPVFLPTTPNPTSGWMILVPTSDLRVLEMTIEDGLKLVVSGGIVGPEDLGPLIRPWTADPRPRPAG